MTPYATGTYDCNLLVVGVCRLYCVDIAIATVCLHKTTSRWFRSFRPPQLRCMLGPPSRRGSWEGFRWSGPILWAGIGGNLSRDRPQDLERYEPWKLYSSLAQPVVQVASTALRQRPSCHLAPPRVPWSGLVLARVYRVRRSRQSLLWSLQYPYCISPIGSRRSSAALLYARARALRVE